MRTLEVRSFSREDLIDYLEYRILPLLKEEYTSGSDRASDSGEVESWTLYGDDEDE